MTLRRSQNGTIIIYTLLVIGAMLTISLVLMRLFIPKLQLARSTIDSTTALAVADTGAELCLYEMRSGTDLEALTLANGASYTIIDLGKKGSGDDITEDCSELDPGDFSFRVVGTYRGVSRAYEVSYSAP